MRARLGAHARAQRARVVPHHAAQWTGDRAGAIRACGGAGAAWSELLAPPMEQLRAALRAHVVALVGASYSAIAIADASAMLDLPHDGVLALAAEHGWAVVTAQPGQPAGSGGGTLQPKPLAKADGARQDLGIGQLAQLTHLIAQLD